MKKRISAAMMAIVMAFSIGMPVTAQAAEGETVSPKSAYNNVRPENAVALASAGDIASGYIRNKYIEAYINSTGNYTIGTVEGDPNSSTDNNKKLLYGHPGSSTTETLVRINDTDYFFDDYISEITFNEAGTECIATALIADTGIKVQQILTLTANPYTNSKDVVRIRYTYSNTSSSSRQVGIRIMLDTMLGENDGAPFRVNGMDVTTEIEYTGSSIPQYWQSFDSLASPNVTATGFFYFSEGEKPDKVQFAYWGDIRGSAWDYTVSSTKSLTGDSAVAAYFNPRTIPAGGRYSSVTYYGISGFSGGNSDLNGDLAVRITAPSALYGSDMIGGYLNNPFDVSVYITNQSGRTLSNVKAVLSLADAPQLTLGTSQATVIPVGNMSSGDNAAIQWRLWAIPQGMSSVVRYSVRFYAGDTVLKKMDLSLDLKELNEKDMYRTVSFDLNGGSGATPAQQRVCIGSFADRPESPVREGYIFAGWYANRRGTGLPWFNLFNCYAGNIVTGDVTLYAKWVLDTQTIEYGTDTFRFINSSSDFFDGGETGTYRISGDYYDVLMKGLGGFLWFGERQYVKDSMNETWGGSCFGMSAVLSLIRSGDLDPSFFQGNADCAYDLNYPRNSRTMFNLINYYHLTQFTNRTQDARMDYDSRNEKPNNEAVMDTLRGSSYPVLMGFNISKNGKVIGGHAVVAYDYTTTDSEYLVKIWDPNDKNTPNTLHISKNYDSSHFERTYDSGSWRSYLKYALTVESDDYDYKNIQDELTKLGHTSGASASARMAMLRLDRTSFLQTNYDSFTISSSDGTTIARIENGMKTDGTLNISDAHYLNEAGSEQNLLFTISGADGDTYIITPAVTEESLTEYTTALRCEGEDGFYSRLSAEDAGTITFSADGTLDTTFAAETAQTITVTTNDASTPWYAVTVKGSTTGMTVSSGSNSTTISCDSNTSVEVTAEDDYNALVFETCTVGAGGVTLHEDPENPGTGILDTQEKQLGHALIFYSLGGTPIEAQTNIPSGSTAVRPENPTRDGFVFAGWYTTPVCKDGQEWSFDTPITGDTRIYAKWLTDDNYMHAVTFKMDGQDDIIILVRDGDSLTENQLPPVPSKTGYTGAWDISDFSNITADITVNAIYTHVDGYIVRFDPNGGSVTTADAVTNADGKLDSIPTPTHTGSYVFDGWYTSASGGTKVTNDTAFTADTTIYAHWKYTGGGGGGAVTQNYTLTFDTNGGSAIDKVSKASGTTINLGKYVPTREGYTFDGWYSDKDLTKAATSVKLTANTTVYAKWTKQEAPAGLPFTDVNTGDWFYNDVKYVYENGMMNGVAPDLFRPNATTTRGMIVTILYRLEKEPAVTGNAPFTDVAAGQWYTDAVNWAAANKVVNGTSPTTFAPNAPITREQMAAILYRYAQFKGYDVTDKAELSKFVDAASVSEYAVDALAWANAEGLINGVGENTLSPKGNAVRAQVAAILARFCENVAK